MKVTFEVCQVPPERVPVDALLTEFYDLMISRVISMGGSAPPVKEAVEEFWEEIDKFLPPNGQLVLVRSEDGALVGCGALKSIGDGKGELKRLFVKPEARGLGLGRRLVEMRIEAARELGLKSLFVDTLQNNLEMRSLYKKMGFKEVESYSESASLKLHPKLGNVLSYYSIDL